jgi:hypothetical protein
MSYSSERALVNDLIARLARRNSPWRSQEVITEFSYGRGRADVLVKHGGEIVAIEAKLSRWRDALDQAYRNMCFAHRSFVCLPNAAAARAAQHVHEFETRGVGLCTIEDDRIIVICDSSTKEPLQPWLSDAAAAAVASASVERKRDAASAA